MSKELKALGKIRLVLSQSKQLFNDIFATNKDPIKPTIKSIEVAIKKIPIIETALKNYEELTSKPIMLCGRTHEHTKAFIDYICKNYKEVKITNLVDEKKTKAFDIIKAKKVDIQLLKDSKNLNDYNWCVHTKDRALTQEKYDLLKEVFK